MIENCLFSRNRLSAEDVENRLSELEAGEFGLWENAQESGASISSEREDVATSSLARFQPPLNCTYFGIEAFLLRRGSLEAPEFAIAKLLLPFSLPVSCRGEYSLVIPAGNGQITVTIGLPVQEKDASIEVMGADASFDLIAPASIGLGRLFDSTWKPVDDRGCEIIRQNHSSQISYNLDFKDFGKFKDILSMLATSDAAVRWDRVSFDASVGFLDVDDVQPREPISDLLELVEERGGFDRYNLDWTHLVSVDPVSREELRLSSDSGKDFREYLGSVECGEGDFEVSLVFGPEGYLFELYSDEMPSSKGSELVRLFDLLDLTA